MKWCLLFCFSIARKAYWLPISFPSPPFCGRSRGNRSKYLHIPSPMVACSFPRAFPWVMSQLFSHVNPAVWLTLEFKSISSIKHKRKAASHVVQHPVELQLELREMTLFYSSRSMKQPVQSLTCQRLQGWFWGGLSASHPAAWAVSCCPLPSWSVWQQSLPIIQRYEYPDCYNESRVLNMS